MLASDSDKFRVTYRHQYNWKQFAAYMARKGEKVLPRVTYLDGELELVTPSRGHERLASWVGCLLLVYAEEYGIELSSFRNRTLRDELVQAGTEPDDCFTIGADPTERTRPDLAIEVQWSRRGIDKLEVYRRLGVKEVWFWANPKASKLDIYVWSRGAWRTRERSKLLPDVDLEHLCSFTDRPSTTKAIIDYRAALKRRKKRS